MDQPIPPVTPTPSISTVQTPKINWLLFSLIGIALLICGMVVGLLVGKYLYSSASAPVVDASPTPSSDPTTDWKTFENENYQYEIKYPKEWNNINSIKRGEKTEPIGLHGSALVGQVVELHGNYPKNRSQPFLEISSWTEVGSQDFAYRKSDWSGEEIIFQGNPAVKSVIDFEGEPTIGLSPGAATNLLIYSERNRTIYEIICNEDRANEGFCNQILSTFKFLGQEVLEEKTYIDVQNRYSFSYPSNWEIVSTIPNAFLYHDVSSKPNWIDYFNSPEGLNWWLNGKMFSPECRGPVLQNTQDSKQLIALEIVPISSDGGFCWSSGYFFEENRWKVGENYMYPITQNNSGKLITPEWKGDYFKFQNLNQNSQWKAFAGLANRETFTLTGEDVLSKIASTFKFSN